jgi:oligoendopeptidase F
MRVNNMHLPRSSPLPLIGILLFGGTSSEGQERDRSKIPEQYKWNLSELYPSDETWIKAKDQFVSEMSGIEKYRGQLSQSSAELLACLELDSRLSKDFARLYSYASMSSDLDTRDSKHLGMKQAMNSVDSALNALSAFIKPEILKMNPTVVEGMIKGDKRLVIYRHNLDDMVRRRVHTGTEGEEKIIADSSLMADAPDNVFGVFANADFPYPEVTLSDGKTVKLNQAAFSVHRTAPNRNDRKKVFAAYFGRANDFRRTYGTLLDSAVRRDLFYAKARKYKTCLDSALDRTNVPVQVYYSLIDNVNRNLSTFHRYLKLRKQMLGVDQLHYYDLYAPLVREVDLKYSIEEAQKHVLVSLDPLGKEYQDVTRRAFSERWVDVYPAAGKRSGAYSNGSAYDVHPYILLNFSGLYSDMSTLTHELGHTMHSYFSNRTQPFPTAQYPIFIAEVASTFNEALLIHHMLKTIEDDNVRLSLLGNYLENVKGTVFRQTQFAEFELRIHEQEEKGEPLTGDVLNSLYADIARKYYGQDQGFCVVDDEVKSEWGVVPHFYMDYYVYQYATAFTASTALSEQVLSGNQEATDRYLQFLKAGGSDYPIQLLKKAGVDMTTSEPFDLTIKKMNRVMEEMEAIIGKKK